MCRLTRNLSDSTEGVIILYLGTSDLSFSYVPCSRAQHADPAFLEVGFVACAHLLIWGGLAPLELFL